MITVVDGRLERNGPFYVFSHKPLTNSRARSSPMRDRVRFEKSADGKEWICYLENHPEISMQARKKAEALGYLIIMFKDRVGIYVKPDQKRGTFDNE